MEGIERYLNSQKFYAFQAVGTPEKPCFEGCINVGGWRLQLELRFHEGKYDFPKAYLSEWMFSPELRQVFGFRHINTNGHVCYVDESRVWWDSSMAVELVAGLLEDIKTLLHENLLAASEDDVIARDFLGYWDGEESLYVGTSPQNFMEFRLFSQRHSRNQWLFEKDQTPWIDFEENDINVKWFAFRLPSPPSNLSETDWPPTTIGQALTWIENNTAGAVHNFLNKIGMKLFSKGKKDAKFGTEIGIILTWPRENGVTEIGAGLSFKISSTITNALIQHRFNNATFMLRNSKAEIKRFSLNQADPKYIQERNIINSTPTLKDKTIILVGAGTIGGYLSKLLCAHGAGWGRSGKLLVIDPDILSIENIGRHLLGADSLGLYKAEALSYRLKMDFPHLQINSYAQSITESWKLFSNDCIVVDATGSQTVSIAIPDYLKRQNLTPVLLHSWVHGHGAATVAFLNNRKERSSACFRCLWQIKQNKYSPRFPISKGFIEDTPNFVGCHQSYHAYASTVSMIAATQAMELLHDYLSNTVDNTLRFNIIRHDQCEKRPNTTPDKSISCPICNR
ncbi:ThiF family adenylyltransferase [Marinomonas sp. RS-M-Aa-14]|uniref:ThiF family adenylyltransferase n=1 Tax=Marinomonas sp. RS-M-Aa-14 TaxID=3241169 RepID=UPI003AABB7DB